jgi:hypothetical protein
MTEGDETIVRDAQFSADFDNRQQLGLAGDFDVAL